MERKDIFYTLVFLAAVFFGMLVLAITGCSGTKSIKHGQLTQLEQFKEQFANDYVQGRISKEEYEELLAGLKDLEKIKCLTNN